MADEFKVHLLNDEGIAKATALSKAFDDLLTAVNTHAPMPSRERSLVVTKLQEACFWAKRAIAVDPANEK